MGKRNDKENAPHFGRKRARRRLLVKEISLSGLEYVSADGRRLGWVLFNYGANFLEPSILFMACTICLSCPPVQFNFTLFTITSKVVMYAPAERADTPPYFSSTPI